eukprot:scaffold1768_cov194-Prasinococcus_capsulatus_cf.AAC.3
MWRSSAGTSCPTLTPPRRARTTRRSGRTLWRQRVPIASIPTSPRRAWSRWCVCVTLARPDRFAPLRRAHRTLSADETSATLTGS